MNSKFKILAVVLAVITVVVALAYMPLTRALQSGEQGTEANCGKPKELELVWWLLNNSEPVEIEGEAVIYHKDVLIVNSDNGQVRIALPEEWTVETNIVTREMLFGSGYLNQGENVTVKALRTNLFEKVGLSIYFLIGYEIIDDTDVHAYAVLPINIEALSSLFFVT